MYSVVVLFNFVNFFLYFPAMMFGKKSTSEEVGILLLYFYTSLNISSTVKMTYFRYYLLSFFAQSMDCCLFYIFG